ncbi:hypothetical protein [Kosakonia cowanii]|uniref:hypothetical protein n=1 Tax=Kosakonia cowanii TaxID=208223 RepID=UPI0040634051
MRRDEPPFTIAAAILNPLVKIAAWLGLWMLESVDCASSTAGKCAHGEALSAIATAKG